MSTNEAPATAAGLESSQNTLNYAGITTAAADGNVFSNSTRTNVPLSGFLTLPRELQMRVLELSCRSPHEDSWRGPLDLDADTAVSLLCTSTFFNALATPILFAHIRIAHPSSLVGLYKAISAHPDRGSMIRSLHLGPRGGLCFTHWPFELHTEEHGELEYNVLWIWSSLHQIMGNQWSQSHYNDEDVAPRWHECLWEFSLDDPEQDCRGRAVYAALEAAMQAIDVDPYNREYGTSKSKIGLAAWSRRIFELRAALDLYLAAMRRLENERNYTISYWRREPHRTPPSECKAGTCPHRYPRLVFDHQSTTPLRIAARASAEVFHLSPLQISRHLARPHKIAKTDRFSHPLFFARSGFPFPDTDIDEEGQNLIARLLAGPHDQEDLGQWHILEGSPQSSPPHNAGRVGSIAGAGQEGEDWPNVTSPGAGDAQDYLRELARPVNASEELMPNAETVGGLLAIGRNIIAMASNVDNLSLTGYFNRLLCSSVPLASQNLRCLSIGPTLPYWKTTFRTQALAQFPKLEHLRLCVPALTHDEIGLIAGEGAALQRLKSVQWEVVEAEEPAVISQPSLASFKELAGRLQQSEVDSSSQVSTSTGKRTRECYERSDLGSVSSKVPSAPSYPLPLRSPRLVQILAHPDVMPTLLDQAPSPHMRSAGSEGRCWSEASDSSHRIHITESKASQTTANWRPSEKVVNQLYNSSKRWWEESAFRCGFRGWGCEEQEGRRRD